MGAAAAKVENKSDLESLVKARPKGMASKAMAKPKSGCARLSCPGQDDSTDTNRLSKDKVSTLKAVFEKAKDGGNKKATRSCSKQASLSRSKEQKRSRRKDRSRSRSGKSRKRHRS